MVFTCQSRLVLQPDAVIISPLSERLEQAKLAVTRHEAYDISSRPANSHDFLTFLTTSQQDFQSHGFLGNIILKCNITLLNTKKIS